MRKVLSGLLVAGLIGLSCSDPGPGDVLSETAANLAEIQSGTLGLAVAVIAEGELEGDAGFELSGPFSFEGDEGLPLIDWDFTRSSGEDTTSTAFISDGESAFIEVDGQAYELPEEQLSQFSMSGDDLESGFEGLEVDTWIENAEVTEQGDTQTIEGDLSVVAAVNDLLGLAGSAGAGASTEIEGEDAERLENAVESSSITLVTGTEDRLLRRLTITIELGAGVPERLEGAGLGSLVSADVTFEMRIENHNEPVEVTAPADALPIEELLQGSDPAGD